MAVIVSYVIIRGLWIVMFFFSSRRRHTRSLRDWSSDVCSSDLALGLAARYGWVPYNAAALVRPPAPRGAKRAMPTREQARQALQAAQRMDPELYLFLRLEATT